jgi:cation transport protein ChaC
MVYKFTGEMMAEVYDYLDLREINGYSRHYLPVYGGRSSSEPVVPRALVYIGTPSNPAYVGPSPIDKTAARIMTCRGPSGDNTE